MSVRGRIDTTVAVAATPRLALAVDLNYVSNEILAGAESARFGASARTRATS